MYAPAPSAILILVVVLVLVIAAAYLVVLVVNVILLLGWCLPRPFAERFLELEAVARGMAVRQFALWRAASTPSSPADASACSAASRSFFASRTR
jgi:hypothetical protein